MAWGSPVSHDAEAPAPLLVSHRLGGPGYGRRSRARSRSMTLTAKVSEDLVQRLDQALEFTRQYMPAAGTTRSAVVAAALDKHLKDLTRAELRVRLGAIPQSEEQ
jgi:hypothetical protein